MWIPGPTRAVLLSTVLIGLLVIFAVYATLQVSNDVHVVYESAPLYPVYTPARIDNRLPPMPPPPLPKMKDLPDAVNFLVERNLRDREGAFWLEQAAYKKGKDFLNLTEKATFWVGDGWSQKTYRFSDYMATQPNNVYRHFQAAHHFYGDVYEGHWDPPTIPTPRHLDLLPTNVQGMQTTKKLWRAAYTYFFGNGRLNALFRYWQDRAGQLKRAYNDGDDGLLDDLPHNP